MTAEPISRAEAKALGLKHYFTGKACPKGHVSKRTTHNTSCAECQREIRERIRRKVRGTVRFGPQRPSPTSGCSNPLQRAYLASNEQ